MYIEADANMKVQMALYNFESIYNIHPNRITMGYHLSNELYMQFCQVRIFEEVPRKVNGVRCEYQGVPVKIDYDNPDILEVGYMVNYAENMY